MRQPKLLTTLRTYDRPTFAADLIAGVTVALVALPLSLAIAIASGAEPAAGITTAIVAGFLISALGGSRVQIGGPTGAFIVVVFGSEPDKWAGYARAPRRDRFLLLLTLVLTVLADLTVAIGVGVALGLALRLSDRGPGGPSGPGWTPRDR